MADNSILAPPAGSEGGAGDTTSAPLPGPRTLSDHWTGIEAVLDRLGDFTNPILVKESRQAMKSRQFVITFSLLMIFGWLWTTIYIAFGVPAIFYKPFGPYVLMGYYVVLSIPLLIVVPYAAFRSLAGEREDGTYELLSITTLSARQIILGKLGSSILQMLVYYSALAPCIAFTYMVGGIDVLTIGMFLGYTFLASLLLSIFGLLMATVTRARHWQILLSVVLVMALLVFTFIWDFTILAIFGNRQSLPFEESQFWMGNLCLLSFYVPLALLALELAAGQITFASENRSTPIRALLVVPQFLLVGWFIYYWLRFDNPDLLYVLVTLLGIYWAVIGSFLTGETAQLSPRAKRRLPQSFVGRMAFTWFNPGSGTGYIFAMLNLMAALLITVEAAVLTYTFDYAYRPDEPEWYCYVVCILGYVLGYIGLVRLAIVGLRQFTHVGMLATFLSQVVVAASVVLFPYLLHAVSVWGDFSNSYYTVLQLPNWFWTLIEVVERGAWGGVYYAIVIGTCGFLVFLVNLIFAAREVEHVRTTAPQRVIEDELALHTRGEQQKRSGPWDE